MTDTPKHTGIDRLFHGIRWRLDLLNPVRMYRQNRLWSETRRSYSKLTIAETFDRIYAEGAWGKGTEEFHSGQGSRGRLVSDYCALVRREIEYRQIRSLADLGCGDFEVGSLLSDLVDEYVGVDVASELIAQNTKRYASPRRRFMRLDLTADRLPSANAAVLRQVLQHLGNEEIRAVLNNVLSTYPLTFVTEHVASSCTKPNVDMTHGPLVRSMMGSGVFIDQPPFSVKAEVIGDVACWEGEVLRTWVVEGRREGTTA